MKNISVHFILLLLIIFNSSILIADEPLPLKNNYEVWSKNKNFVADISHDLRKIKVYKIIENEKRKEIWQMKGWHRWIGLSNDGNYLAIPYSGANLLRKNFDKQQVMLIILKRGKIVKTVKLNELIKDFHNLQKTVSHYNWGKFVGFNNKNEYIIETVENNRFIINPNVDGIKTE